MRLFISLFLISFSAFATTWDDLVPGQKYKLTQTFQLPQTERSGSLLDFTKGDEVELKTAESVSPPGVSLMLYTFNYKNCPGPLMTTEMEIIPIKGTSVEAGVTLESGCELTVYIETHDIYSQSLFE